MFLAPSLFLRRESGGSGSENRSNPDLGNLMSFKARLDPSNFGMISVRLLTFVASFFHRFSLSGERGLAEDVHLSAQGSN